MNTLSHNYKHLSIIERAQIELLLKQNKSISKIAALLNRSKSTICLEINKHKYNNKYSACIAQNRADKAKTTPRKQRKFCNIDLLHFIERQLKERWAPETIAEKWSQRNPQNPVSHTSIYTIIKKHRPNWHKYLAYQKQRKYHTGKKGKTLIPDRVDISQRPQIVDERTRIGDFEADTVVSKQSKTCLAVFVDRAVRLYKIAKMPDKSAEQMSIKTIQTLSKLNPKTITYDNGTENANHMETNKILGTQSYFCRPYKSQDKGLIENRNKILRQFLPKKTNFDLITDEQLATIETQINNRPLKCLNWLSPIQAFNIALNDTQTLNRST
jgi:IS30 family transposase